MYCVPRLNIPNAQAPISEAAMPGRFRSPIGSKKLSTPSALRRGPMPK